jgi:peptidylprolyl isomerase
MISRMPFKLMAAAAAVLAVAAPMTLPASALAQAASDWRTVAPENLLVIDTAKGRVLVEVSPLAAPNHVERIRTLANQGFYDGLKFHRVIPNFMAQTGDPQGTGQGGSDLPDLKAEFSFRRGADAAFARLPTASGMVGLVGALPVQTQPDAQMMITADFKVDAGGLFCTGVLGMARAGSPDSANSQFFLMTGERDILNGQYTAFGRVLSGQETLRALNAGSEAEDGKVANPDVMTRVRMASALPEGERPTVRVQTAAAAVAAAQAAGQTNVCAIQPTAEVTGG